MARVAIEIIGDDRRLRNAFRRSARDARTFNAQITGMSRSVTRALGFSAAVGGLAGLGLAMRSTISAAIDFESSFAGVRKTVDATEPQFEQLAQGFRDLSREIPVSVNELNRIGEAAGQLGIQREAILAFSRTVADLGVTTNLASDEAATSLARLANITQLPQDQFDRLGATIVDLGNKLATTEREIVEFGLRVAGAGKNVGLTDAQILAIGAAFSSVGVEAERGGTAISKTLLAMQTAVLGGGKTLQQFARVAGLSAAQFRESFEQDAGATFTRFVEGLARIRAEGGNTAKALADLGLTDQRLVQAFLSVANAGDLLRNSLEIGTQAFRENIALTEEATKRYETTASRLQIFRNRVNDLQITLGEVLAPALLEIVEPLGEWLAKTENQERAQRELTNVLGQSRAALEGVRDVVVPLARAARIAAENMGGLRNAVQFLLVALIATKVLKFALGIETLGAQAAVSTGRVAALRLALLRLGAIGVITLGITVLLNKDQIEGAVDDFLRRHKLGFLTGPQIEIPVNASTEDLRRMRDEIAAATDETSLLVRAFDKLIAQRQRAGRGQFRDARPSGLVAGPGETARALQTLRNAEQAARLAEEEADAATGAAEKVARNLERARKAFARHIKGLGLKLDRAQLTSDLTDDLAALREMESSILRRIQAEGRTFELEKQLVDVRSQLIATTEQIAEDNATKAREAFDTLIDSLSLGLERAEVTKSLQDDLAALDTLEKAIRERIKVEGRTVDLERELFRIQQQRRDLRREQAQRVKDARQADQFKALGLTETGEERIPGVSALRRQLGSMSDAIKGTFLDTGKTRNLLDSIRKLLSGKLGQLGRDVRAKIAEILDDINRQLEAEESRPAGARFQKAKLNQILAGLGLDPDEIKALRQRLAQVSPTGRVPGKGVSAFGFAIPAGGAVAGGGGNIIINGPVNVQADSPDAFMRELQKRAQRGSMLRTGTSAGRNRGLG